MTMGVVVMTPKTWSVKKVIDKLDFVKSENSAKNIINRIRTQVRD